MSEVMLMGGGTVPVGTIISFMGNNAPKGYLKCDGSVLNIADYPLLAAHFETEFGTKNNFGGDGTTTFGVPDLQGDFLMGCAAGDPSGVHTDEGLPEISGFIQVALHANANTSLITSGTGAFTLGGSAAHANATYSGSSTRASGANFNASKSNAIYGKSLHVTPNNTSVWYCIKY